MDITYCDVLDCPAFERIGGSGTAVVEVASTNDSVICYLLRESSEATYDLAVQEFKGAYDERSEFIQQDATWYTYKDFWSTPEDLRNDYAMEFHCIGNRLSFVYKPLNKNNRKIMMYNIDVNHEMPYGNWDRYEHERYISVYTGFVDVVKNMDELILLSETLESLSGRYIGNQQFIRHNSENVVEELQIVSISTKSPSSPLETTVRRYTNFNLPFGVKGVHYRDDRLVFYGYEMIDEEAISFWEACFDHNRVQMPIKTLSVVRHDDTATAVQIQMYPHHNNYIISYGRFISFIAMDVDSKTDAKWLTEIERFRIVLSRIPDQPTLTVYGEEDGIKHIKQTHNAMLAVHVDVSDTGFEEKEGVLTSDVDLWYDPSIYGHIMFPRAYHDGIPYEHRAKNRYLPQIKFKFTDATTGNTIEYPASWRQYASIKEEKDGSFDLSQWCGINVRVDKTELINTMRDRGINLGPIDPVCAALYHDYKTEGLFKEGMIGVLMNATESSIESKVYGAKEYNKWEVGKATLRMFGGSVINVPLEFMRKTDIGKHMGEANASMDIPAHSAGAMAIILDYYSGVLNTPIHSLVPKNVHGLVFSLMTTLGVTLDVVIATGMNTAVGMAQDDIEAMVNKEEVKTEIDTVMARAFLEQVYEISLGCRSIEDPGITREQVKQNVGKRSWKPPTPQSSHPTIEEKYNRLRDISSAYEHLRIPYKAFFNDNASSIGIHEVGGTMFYSRYNSNTDTLDLGILSPGYVSYSDRVVETSAGKSTVFPAVTCLYGIRREYKGYKSVVRYGEHLVVLDIDLRRPGIFYEETIRCILIDRDGREYSKTLSTHNGLYIVPVNCHTVMIDKHGITLIGSRIRKLGENYVTMIICSCLNNGDMYEIDGLPVVHASQLKHGPPSDVSEVHIISAYGGYIFSAIGTDHIRTAVDHGNRKWTHTDLKTKYFRPVSEYIERRLCVHVSSDILSTVLTTSHLEPTPYIFYTHTQKDAIVNREYEV